MSEADAYAAFKAIRFAENGGEPECARCGCTTAYTLKRMKKVSQTFRCKECRHEFTVTSATLFNSRKMDFRDIMLAVVLFVNGANGTSALRLSRELQCSHKTAYVLFQKVREALGALHNDRLFTGIVEIDGVHVGGHIKKTNLVKNRKDRRATNPKRRAVVTIRERRPGGRSRSQEFRHESESIDWIAANVHPAAKVRTDEASHWIRLRRYFADVRSVNHKSDGFSINGIHTNGVEGAHSRLRRGERGVYHRISGRHLQRYADEFSFREDFRRSDNGRQFSIVMHLAAQHPVSRTWKGAWQKRGAA